jgi:LysM repeat protein
MQQFRNFIKLASLLMASTVLAACVRPATQAPTGLTPGIAKQGDPTVVTTGSQPNQQATAFAVQTLQALEFESSRKTQEAAAAGQVTGNTTGEQPTNTVVQLATVPPVVVDQPTAVPTLLLLPTPVPIVVQPTVEPVASSQPVADAPTTYTVQPGDWIYQIARKLNISPTALIQANPGINPNQLQPGQVISIPAGAVAIVQPDPAQQGNTHVVAAGENLYRIAINYNTTYQTLASLNGLVAPYTVYGGQVLRLP